MSPSRAVGRRLALTTGLAGVAVLVAGCSGGDEPKPTADHHARGGAGAEPALAPTPTVEPAGRVVPVGYSPEGIVLDPASGLLAVGVRRPDRLVLLDPATLAVRRTVTVPGTVRHLGLTAGGGTVLVANEAADELVEVDTATGRTRTTPVGHVPHDATGAEGGDLLVGDEFSGSMSVVRDGRVVHTFDDMRQPGGVVADGRTALAVDVADWSVTSYDLDAMTRVARVPAGEGPTHGILARPGLLAVADTRGDALLLFSVTPLRPVGSLALAGSPYGLAADERGGLVWVTLTARNEVVGVDVTGSSPREVARYPTVQQPNTVAVEPGSRTLWVASRTDGTVQRITR
ncbi:YncE family protein [Arthrobacter sp. NEB 688]|uniref:YncE family protein n=1 Tax=Arthrobacter sp. NEB 688 TaxID=904039 RepID=UPI0015642716|nr:YncE family protein [Arthrobacter sp. NEB 688]QKE83270.1 YncE family protein [Arthrobacter sp. NEB 688]